MLEEIEVNEKKPMKKRWIFAYGALTAAGFATTGFIVAPYVTAWWLGLASIGPVLGSSFSSAQATGVVVKGSTYAALQSWYMGGKLSVLSVKFAGAKYAALFSVPTLKFWTTQPAQVVKN